VGKTADTVAAPGFARRPDYPMTITPAADRCRATLGDALLAESDAALVVREADYPPVIYFPRGDVAMALLAATDSHTHCPFKGDAVYFRAAQRAGKTGDIAWSYETPFVEAAALRQHIAFYGDRVSVTGVP
jgi:uncharacterized protein (DUF427 family)